MHAAGIAGSTSSAAEAGEEGVTKKSTHRPRLRTHCHQRTHQKRRLVAFRLLPPQPKKLRYRRTGRAITVPRTPPEGAVTLYPVTNLP